MIFLNGVQGVLSIILMIGIGYFLSFKGWFDQKSSKLISKLVVSVALPAYMISNLMGTYDKDKLLHLGNGLVVPFLTMGSCYLLGMILAKVLKLPENRRGTFTSMFALSNTIFVGLPVNLALFGDQSVPYVLLYYIGNTTLFWTIGTYGISRDGGKKDKGLFTLDNAKRIFSPPLTGFLIAVALILLGVTLPKSIMETCKYLGNMTTPLSMLFIGIVIHSVKLSEIRVDKGMVAVLVGRFIITPLVMIILCRGLALPLLMKKVFVVQAAMPVMTQTSIIAQTYGGDYEYAAVVTTVTTVVSLISIPLYMLLLNTPWIF